MWRLYRVEKKWGRPLSETASKEEAEDVSVFSAQARHYALGVLVVVYTFNFIDRQILPILLEPIKQDLGLSDTQLGLLTGFACSRVAPFSHEREVAPRVEAWTGTILSQRYRTGRSTEATVTLEAGSCLGRYTIHRTVSVEPRRGRKQITTTAGLLQPEHKSSTISSFTSRSGKL